ncbi:Amino Acid/Auxin Permease (AAAP) Family [Trachipleistophora hominis]|uniref:Amino Acid/Auxin Permease (AAAP) Family n=1 Tax=Trachipleistophora hominis TaxID=72359 RepID=L7JT59_TRAHO|nr:Amino Acid/Auxin Permease (AAAP) Family [Trachipleistophora hominis]
MGKNVSAIQGSILMMNTMFGVGVLYLPLIYYSLGWVQGLVLFVMVASVTALTMYLLGVAAIESEDPHPTYYSVCSRSFRFMGPCADIAILLCCFFCCMAYLTFITNTVHFEIKEAVPKPVITVIAAFLVFMLAVQKDLSSLKIASFVSVASIVYLACFVVYVFVVNRENVTVLKFNKDYSTGVSGLLFALGCQQNMVAVYSQLKDGSRAGVLKVAIGATLMGGLLYMAIGLFGYFGFGEAATTNILRLLTDRDSDLCKMLLKRNSVNKYAIRACDWLFIVTLSCSFAFQSHPARVALNNILRKFVGVKKEVLASNKYRYIATGTYVALICIIACFQVDCDKIVAYIGATCNNAICYIMPALAFIGLVKRSTVLRPIAYAVVALGAIGMIYMVAMNIIKETKK